MSNPFDGTWTMILGDQDANPELNTRYVIEGDAAWDENKPDSIGSCIASDSGFTVTLRTKDKQGHSWTETLSVHGDSAARSLSGLLHYAGPDGVAFSDPCRMHRFDLHPSVPTAKLGLVFGKRASG